MKWLGMSRWPTGGGAGGCSQLLPPLLDFATSPPPHPPPLNFVKAPCVMYISARGGEKVGEEGEGGKGGNSVVEDSRWLMWIIIERRNLDFASCSC